MPTVQGYGGWKKGAPAADSSSLTEDRRKQAEFTEYLNTQSNINTGPLPTAPYGPVAVWRGPVPFGSTALQLGYAGGGPSRKSFSLGKIFSSGNNGLDLAGFTLGSTLPAFTPLSIAGALLWLDAADSSTITGTSAVTAWRDKSGMANNMSLTGAGVSYASNKVTFAEGGIMTSALSSTITNSQSVVFIVSEITTINSQDTAMVFVCSDLNDYSIRYTSRNLLSSDSGDIGFSSGYYVNGNLGVPSGGVITIPSGPNIIYGLFNRSGTTRFALSSAFSTRYFIGNIQEVLVFTGSITVSQRQQVEGYLAWKWGLQGSLPANHPYKKTPPVG